jgi:hypothetical protein
MIAGTSIAFHESVATLLFSEYAKFSIAYSTTGLVIVIARVTEVLTPFASVAVTVKVNVPLPVGVPLIFPVAGSTVSPTGSAPSVTANVIGVFPPETFRASEYGVPVVPINPDVGAVIAAAATIGPLAGDMSVMVPALLVAVVFKRTYLPTSNAPAE